MSDIVFAGQGDGLTSEMVFSHVENDHAHFVHEHCEADCLVRIPVSHWGDLGMPRKLLVIMIASETLDQFMGPEEPFEI